MKRVRMCKDLQLYLLSQLFIHSKSDSCLASFPGSHVSPAQESGNEASSCPVFAC